MPNTGRPSPSCHLCRTRRIKCDLMQPECLRCTTYGAVCPGYRPEADLVFRHESPGNAAKNVRKRRRSRGSRNSAVSSTGPATVLQQTGAEQHSSVGRLLDRLTAATPKSSSYGFLAFLPEIYEEAEPGCCIIQATDALVHAYLGKDARGAYSESSKELYCAALQATNLALNSPGKASTDAAIATVWLLAAYEMIAAHTAFQAPARPRAWYHHTQGLETLIELRGPEQFKTRRGRNIFWVSFDQMVLRFIETQEACPPIYRQWLADITPYVDDEDRSALAVYSFLLDVSAIISFVARALHGLPTPADAFAAVLELFRRLEVIDATNLPYDLLSRFPRQGYLWNNYRCVRALMYHAVVQLLDWASLTAAEGDWLYALTALRELKRTSMQIVREMIQALLTDIGAGVGGCPREEDIGAGRPRVQLHIWCWGDTLNHLWAVSHIAQRCGAEDQQKESAVRLLEQIGRDLGMEEPPQEVGYGN